MRTTPKVCAPILLLALLTTSCIWSTETARLGALTHTEHVRVDVFAAHGGRSSHDHRVTVGGSAVGRHVKYCRREGSVDSLEGKLALPGQSLVFVLTDDAHGLPASRAMDATTGAWLEDAWVDADYTGSWAPRAFCCGSDQIVRQEDDNRVLQRTLRQGNVVTRRAFSFGPHLFSREQVESHLHRSVRCLAEDGVLALVELSYRVPKDKLGPRIGLWLWPRTSAAPISLGIHEAPASCPRVDGERIVVEVAGSRSQAVAHTNLYSSSVDPVPCGALDVPANLDTIP